MSTKFGPPRPKSGPTGEQRQQTKRDFWCGRWDSNPQALRRHPLKMVRLPVPLILAKALPQDAPKSAAVIRQISSTSWKSLKAVFGAGWGKARAGTEPKRLVRSRGLEPPRSCERQPLKLVRLPVPPRPLEDGERILAGSDRQGKSNVAANKLPPRWASEGSQEWFPSAQRDSWSYQLTTF